MLIELLIIGLVLGAAFLLVAFLLPRSTGQILFIGLIIAALAYAYFYVKGDAAAHWSLVELAGILVYGTMGALGLRTSAWWFVAGWALHPLWDVGLHYFGPGRSFAPVRYTIACVSFDLLVAGYVAYKITRGWRPTVTH